MNMMQDLNPGAGVWWANMPLPPGWNAKYDNNAKKYFFIHHSTRSTQWVDPRKAYYEQQGRGGIAPAPSPRMAHSAQRMPQSSPRMQHNFQRMPMHAGSAIPMQTITKPKCKTCKINEVPSANQDCQGCQLKARQREAELVRVRKEAEAERREQEYQQGIQKEQQERRRIMLATHGNSPVTSHIVETSFNSEPEREELTFRQKRAMIENLDDAFPGVERSVVEMVLETSSWDSSKATSVLMTMGPKEDKKKSAAARQAAAAAAKPKAPAPAKPASPKQPSAAAKRKMVDQLKKIFPSASETLIELALETTHYNQAKATQVLRMTINDNRKAEAKKSDAKAKTTTRVTTPSSVTISINSAGSSGVSTTSSITGAQPKSSAPVSTSVSTPSPRPTSASASPSPGSAAAPSSSLPSTPAASRQAKAAARAKGAACRTRSAERPPPNQEFSSLFSSTIQGPNASLVHGPDKTNLLETYVNFSGNDRSILHGSRKENVTGPARRDSRKASLAVGPQTSHCTGAQASLAKGSMRTVDRQM